MAKKQTMTLDQALQVILATDGENPLRQMLEWMVQQALEHEMGEHLGADRYQRSDERLGYRNGHKTRVFTTAVGDLNLLVPQDRDGTFSTGSSSATSAATRRSRCPSWRCTSRASPPARWHPSPRRFAAVVLVPAR